MTIDATLPILGPPIVTHLQAVDTFMAKRRSSNGYTRPDLNKIFRTYADLCASTGLSFGVVAAQIAHEAGWLTSWWSARPRRNPSGIAVTDSKTVFPTKPVAPAEFDQAAGGWRLGIAFPDWEHAAVAHVGRLLAYVLPARTGTPAQRDAVAQALAVRPLPAKYRGCAMTLRGLEGTWASPGLGYGTKLAEKIATILEH